MTDDFFEKRKSVEQVEESSEFAPRFDENGLIPVVTTDFESGELLMQGYMNSEALTRTIKLGEAVYYSRSRKTLWHKGKESGFIQTIKEIRIDDDQDCVWLRVKVSGGQVAMLVIDHVFIEVFLSEVQLLNLKLFWNSKKKKRFLMLIKYMGINSIQQNCKIR